MHCHGLSGQRGAALTGQLDLPQGLWDDLHLINFLSGRKNKGELFVSANLGRASARHLASGRKSSQDGNIDKVLDVSCGPLSPGTQSPPDLGHIHQHHSFLSCPLPLTPAEKIPDPETSLSYLISLQPLSV